MINFMHLSDLQKFILRKAGENEDLVFLKKVFFSYYKDNAKIKKKNIQDTVHRSLENLTGKNLIIAYGRKTKEKWFIDKIKLSNQGKEMAKQLLTSRQRKLPIK